MRYGPGLPPCGQIEPADARAGARRCFRRSSARLRPRVTGASEPVGSSSLQALPEARDEVTDTVRMRPGDLLILDNARVVHGHTAFTPRWDGRARRLHRTYARSLPHGPGRAEAAFPYQPQQFAPC
ncbi:TauD/TfdA family dioxygenase [Streptomyces sp. NPDC086077]|uniref:TauD/TfdA family dioxygenase n=1 Tax=Streptomyces sp. NPDC086077 TaxID=3154862 RepID=UPI00343879E4